MSDLSTTSWSETDASNSTFPPEGWPAGMFPNAVEPTARMMMGAMKRFWNRVSPIYAATLTTTDTFAVTEAQALVGYSLYERRATRFPAANVSTSVTVNHSALGAVFFKKWNGTGTLVNLASGDIQAQEHEYYWDGTQMVLLNPTTAVIVSATNKASPTTSDSMVITDAAAAGIQKASLFSAFPLAPILGPLANKATPTSSDSVVITDAAANNVGKRAVVGALVTAVTPISPFSKSFTSTQQTITAGGALTLAHSLGAQPTLFTFKLHCTTGELGYTAGDEVIINPSENGITTGRGISVVPDATNINVRYGSDAASFEVLRKDTGAFAAIANANWTLIVKAWV